MEKAIRKNTVKKKSSGSSSGKNSSKKKSNKRKKKVSDAKVLTGGAFLVIAVAFLYRAGGCYVDLNGIPGAEPADDVSTTDKGTGLTNVHFLDVGQGDSILIRGTEKTILIDGGERDQGDNVLADLKELGVETIDCIIATHPHSDHIGGLVDVLEYAADYNDLEIKDVIIPDIPEEYIPTTAVYADFLDGVEANSLSVTFAEFDMTINIGSGVLTIYPPPTGENYSSLNDYSVCAHLECGDTSFFFTGDMEQPEEEDLLQGGYLKGVTADVLKAGHHGSDTASSEELLAQLEPEYVVISCGEGNSYGHPHKEALARFKKYTDDIYRTDLEGTITCTTDGKNLAWSMEGNS